MEVIYSLDHFKYKKKSVCTIGTFDGVHLGHQKVVAILDVEAADNDYHRLMITFSTHPAFSLGLPPPSIILSLKEKIALLRAEKKIDTLIVLPFQDIYQYSFLDFGLKILSAKLNVKKLIMGYDNRVGKKREGSYQNMKKILPVQKIHPVQINEEIVSSTLIRKNISDGNLDKAEKMLGYRYFLTGQVIQGQQIGRKINFPTANLTLDQEKIMPPYGVYSVLVDIAGSTHTHHGILNFGKKPTLDDSHEVCLEVHILNFNENIYHAWVKVTFLKFIRSEKKFTSLEKLKAQIQKDIKAAFS